MVKGIVHPEMMLLQTCDLLACCNIHITIRIMPTQTHIQ